MFVCTIILLILGTEVALIAGELLILIVPLIYLMSKRINIKDYINIQFTSKNFLIGLVCALLLFLLNIAASALLTAIFGNSQAVIGSNTTLINLSSTGLGLITVVLSLSLAGICEEFALRGFLQNSLTKRFSFLPAVVISSLVFGIFHFDIQFFYIIATFISGLALGAIYYKWGYITAATAHSVMNLIVLSFLLLGI